MFQNIGLSILVIIRGATRGRNFIPSTSSEGILARLIPFYVLLISSRDLDDCRLTPSIFWDGRLLKLVLRWRR